jgi:hypothetical protein
MRNAYAAVCFAAILSAVPAIAQTPGGGGPSGPGVGGSTVQAGGQMGRDVISAEDFNKLQDYADMSKRLNGEQNKGKTVEDLMKEDKEAATQLAGSMTFSCQVEKAILAAQGPETIDGKTIQTKTYETVCANGMGYFLTSRDAAHTSGITCFAADTSRQADQAAGRKPGPVCALPELADPKAMATTIMTRVGTPCTVRDWRWLGQSSASHTEFDEVACTDDRGFILSVALPGSAAPVRVATCRESALRGLPCKLSDNGGEIVTVATFRDALKQRGLACDAGNKDIHLFGQENIQKRFVVEFKCSQHPQGLVTYIPLNGVKAPFEAMDCTTAAKRGVKCALTPPKP